MATEDEPRIRVAATSDIAAIVDLNNTAIPAVGSLDESKAAHLLSIGGLHLVVDGPGGLSALLLTLDRPGLDYDSVNYRWFCGRYPGRFLYVDRVVVAEDDRSRGLGEVMYRRVAAMADLSIAVMCAEVNLRPPNEGSVRFHQRLGFVEAGQQETEGGSKRVVMVERPLPFWPHR